MVENFLKNSPGEVSIVQRSVKNIQENWNQFDKEYSII